MYLHNQKLKPRVRVLYPGHGPSLKFSFLAILLLIHLMMTRHSSEILDVKSNLLSRETLYNLPYFIYTKTQSCFFHVSFHAMYFIFSPYECPDLY